MGMAVILVMWPGSFKQFYATPPQSLEATYEILLKLVQLFQSIRHLKLWMDELRMTTAEPAYTHSSPKAFSSSELKNWCRLIDLWYTI